MKSFNGYEWNPTVQYATRTRFHNYFNQDYELLFCLFKVDTSYHSRMTLFSVNIFFLLVGLVSICKYLEILHSFSKLHFIFACNLSIIHHPLELSFSWWLGFRTERWTVHLRNWRTSSGVSKASICIVNQFK